MDWTGLYRMRDIPKVAGVAVVYFLIAYVTNAYFHGIGMTVPIMRPAVGFAFAMTLVVGIRFWPALFVGSFASRMVLGDSVAGAMLLAAGVSAGSVLGAWLLLRDKKFDPSLPSTNHYFRLMLWSGVVGAGLSAISGALALPVQSMPVAMEARSNLLQWWMGDTLGTALLTPLFLTWKTPPRHWLRPQQLPELLLYFALTFLAGQTIFLGWFHDVFGPVARGYWMFLFIVWGGSRFGIHCVTVVLPLVMIQALTGAAGGVGYFGGDIAESHLRNVWFYLLCLSVVGLGLGTTVNAFKLAQAKIRELALHDVLTGLANRRLLTERINQGIAMAKRDKRRVGIIFHDLDHFKPVNDVYGHRVGDLLLRAVAERVQERVRASDTVGRIGGDEFVIVLPDIADVSDILVVAEKMREALRQSFVIEGHVIHLSTSIGIAIYPEHGTTESELIVNADNAMYCAKRRGRDGFCVYQAGVQQAGRRE